ncbi:STM3941 family protein [Actinomyces sp. ZJ308]|uniref:STM3941 family protein n=1 Tax=Actinomyces sp. ZJ308 TaxID=2708342 RepID=UPI00141E4DE9|nr:STM3941 family protein [Actinomyces sp. ZJ308]
MSAPSAAVHADPSARVLTASSAVLRGKIGAFAVFVLVGLVSVCLWTGFPVDLMSQSRRLPMFAIMGMVACVIGLPLSLVDLWRYLSGPKPTLVIDSVGVHDHLSRDSVGLIRWEEIEGFNARTLNGWLKIGNNDCVLVYLRAPQATLERLRPTLPPRVVRRMERSFSHGHTTIPIPALLGIPVTSMTSLLRDEMGKRTGRS